MKDSLPGRIWDPFFSIDGDLGLKSFSVTNLTDSGHIVAIEIIKLFAFNFFTSFSKKIGSRLIYHSICLRVGEIPDLSVYGIQKKVLFLCFPLKFLCGPPKFCYIDVSSTHSQRFTVFVIFHHLASGLNPNELAVLVPNPVFGLERGKSP
jgi:hypothetical protein